MDEDFDLEEDFDFEEDFDCNLYDTNTVNGKRLCCGNCIYYIDEPELEPCSLHDRSVRYNSFICCDFIR